MDDLLTEFLAETNEGLAHLEKLMLDLERSPDDAEIVRTIFRIIHTIKGTCGFLGLSRLEVVSHATENVLSKMRDGELGVSPVIMGTLLVALDRLRAIVSGIEQGDEDKFPSEDEVVIKALNDCLKSESQTVSEPIVESPDTVQSEEAVVESVEEAIEATKTEIVESVQAESVKPEVVEKVKAEPKKQEDAEPKKQNVPVSQQFIRVHIDILDNLINLISELVLTRNQLLQFAQSSIDPVFNIPLSRLSYITTELQEEVMKTRMQNIENAWAKFPRIIHDLSKELGKKIELVQIGGDTELDRQVLELIKDPLTHMIRNSADHGLEMPDVRERAGKNPTGTITLNAFHEGGQIVIEIKDDGAGIDPVKLKKNLIEKGLITTDEAATLTDWQVINYIFKPGFSTASSVTSVSGRGVGMDVVKSNIEKLSGTIDLQSVVGQGTTFTIKIPLTLTIISALIFESQGERFAIPQLSVTELVRVSKRSAYQIEFINKTPILRLRQGLLPLIFLENLLGIKKSDKPLDQRELCVIVIYIGNTGFGIVVDRVYDTQEIVVKPLAKVLNSVKFFSGSTILGDGGIVLILDQNAISNQLKDINGSENLPSTVPQFKGIHDKTLLLLFRDQTHNCAVPLALVSRIAEVSMEQLEFINDTWLIRYQDHLLPVTRFAGEWDKDQIKRSNSATMPMLIFSDRGYAMGLAIEEIVNIIEYDLEIEIANKKEGSLGTTLINGKTTNIVDCEYYLEKSFPGWFDHRTVEAIEGVRKIKVLFIDDSQFFRSLFTPLLSMSGFEVVTANSGVQALKICRNRSDFDIIISDIEMPEMSGFELATELRKLPVFQDKMLIAMTSRSTDADIAYSMECGFNLHFSKTQQKQLIEKIHEIRKNILNKEYQIYAVDE